MLEEKKQSVSNDENRSTLRDIARRIDRLDKKLQPAIDYVRQSALAHLIGYTVAALSLVSIIVTLIQVQLDLEAREQERIVQGEERVDRAWTKLMMPMGGNIGKGYALGLVLADGNDFNALDLSCKAAGGWNKENETCDNPPFYEKFKIDYNGINLDLYRKKMEGDPDAYNGVAYNRGGINLAVFDEAIVSTADFSGSQIGIDGTPNVRFYGTNFSTTAWVQFVSSIKFSNCDLSFSAITVTNFTAAPFENVMDCNLSGINVFINFDDMPKTFGPQPSLIFDNWAWADLPPVSYDSMEGKMYPAPVSVLSQIRFCDPAYREDAAIVQGAPFSASIIPEAQGINPRIEDHSWKMEDGYPVSADKERYEQACPRSLNWKAAAKKYPDRYPPLN